MTDAPSAEYRRVKIMLCPDCRRRTLVRRADLLRRLAVVECANPSCEYALGWATWRERYDKIVDGVHRDVILGRPVYGLDPSYPAHKMMQQVAFWEKVNRDAPAVSHRHDIGNCWEWTGRLNQYGYGEHENKLAHRIAWELSWNGEIPAGAFICHRCDNRKCVRPSHLFLGNALLNAVDRDQKGRGLGGSRARGRRTIL